MAEAAAELRVSRRWLQEYIKRIPCCYMLAGHRKLFDEIGLETIRAAMRREAEEKCRTNSLPPRRAGRHIGAFADRNSESPLTELLNELNVGKPRKYSPNGARKQSARLS